jgi:hypothetical protein
MSAATDCRIASLHAFAQARAMGSATNAGGGAVSGGADCGRDSDGKFGAGNTCRIGININDSTQAFTTQILAGQKTIETRPTNSLRPYVGKTVGIVRTGQGKATLVGTMKIGEPKFYKTKKDFDADRKKHLVSPGSPHYITAAGKYGYPLSEVRPVKPIELDTKGIVGRVIAKSSRSEELEYDLDGVELRAFCPTGEGGGLDNSCGSGETASTPPEKTQKPRWMGAVDAAGETKHGTWFLEKNEDGSKSPGHDEATSHVVSLVGGKDEIKAFVFADAHDDRLYINYSHVAEPHRGKGVYKELLSSLQEQFTIHSDEQHNVATAAKKAYESLGARLNQYGQYVLERKRRDSRGSSLGARHASLLAFAQSRDCGRDPDGKFSSGNTCAGGVAADAAKGAIKGAAEGGLLGLWVAGPPGAKTGAVAGAAVGAAKGIYDNQMRPTRVKKAIDRLGLTDQKVGRLVEKLGGTPESSANAKRGVLTLTIRDKDNKKTFHVEVTKKGVTVYPRRATGELSGKEIARIKQVAKDLSPRPVSVTVKQSSSAYVAKLVKSGFKVTAGKVAGTLVANYVVPTAIGLAVTASEGAAAAAGVAAAKVVAKIPKKRS